MKLRCISSEKAHDLKSGYSQAVEICGEHRTLYVSGQIPVRPDGTVPETFVDQARQVWSNIEAQLTAANMTIDNIVKHTTFLSDRRYRSQNSQIRKEVMGDNHAALTVIITGIFDEGWLLEIEAIAVA